ncbi:MAG TPA: cupin domain-containing protein [Edaphobacter sp.]|jgi:mannose-6-phosphate isomerase-like protein (cupin superfamily)|nr:cupin domain-containing protein [Edaphobacter sp.]
MPILALEADEPIARSTDPARFFTYAGVTIDVKATAGETGGAFSLIELTVPGLFPGAPLHYHKTFVESFYIVEGELATNLGDQSITARAGDVIHIPIGMLHGYRNKTNRPVRILVICTPGGFDSFFTELIAWMKLEPRWPPADRSKLTSFGLEHDTFYV